MGNVVNNEGNEGQEKDKNNIENGIALEMQPNCKHDKNRQNVDQIFLAETIAESVKKIKTSEMNDGVHFKSNATGKMYVNPIFQDDVFFKRIMQNETSDDDTIKRQQRRKNRRKSERMIAANNQNAKFTLHMSNNVKHTCMLLSGSLLFLCII
ncbi:MAG: hypothetical protein HOE25_01180, partial [Flavobacteriales bacterium]|nr:hypothetical protein [Flavobacteriales bacterium]